MRNKILWSLIASCLVGCFTSVHSHTDKLKVQSIAVTTFSFTADLFVPFTTSTLLETCQEDRNNRCTTTSVIDKDFLEYISRHLDSLTDKDTLSREHSGLDVRLVCLLQRRGARIDTISFGGNMGLNPPAMKINNNYYRLDKELLRTIAVYVPEVHRSGILHYVDIIVPKYEEMLDNYYREHPEEPDRRKR